MIVVGIDPGLEGALAFLADDGGRNGDWLETHDAPVFAPKKGKRELDIAALAAFLAGLDHRSTHVFLERAQAYPGMGASSAFNYGTGFGVYRGIIATLSLPLTLVAPAVWKKALQVGADKEDARRRASMLMPAKASLWPLKKHHGRSEAALIAWFGAQKLGMIRFAKAAQDGPMPADLFGAAAL